MISATGRSRHGSAAQRASASSAPSETPAGRSPAAVQPSGESETRAARPVARSSTGSPSGSGSTQPSPRADASEEAQRRAVGADQRVGPVVAAVRQRAAPPAGDLRRLVQHHAAPRIRQAQRASEAGHAGAHDVDHGVAHARPKPPSAIQAMRPFSARVRRGRGRGADQPRAAMRSRRRR